MSKPKFEFLANSALPGDESGVAIWRYIEERGTDDVEIVVRQEFQSFRVAFEINGLLDVLWAIDTCPVSPCPIGLGPNTTLAGAPCQSI